MIKALLKPFFIAWEILYSWIHNIHVVENSPYGLLRIKVYPYRGQPVTLKDNTQIRDGDLVAELHISNLVLTKGRIGDIEISSSLHTLPLFREEFKNLASMVREGKLGSKVTAIFAITLMGPGLRRMGFSLLPMASDRKSRSLKRWMSFLGWLFSPSGVKYRSRSRTSREPQQCWMSVNELLSRYG